MEETRVFRLKPTDDARQCDGCLGSSPEGNHISLIAGFAQLEFCIDCARKLKDDLSKITVEAKS